MNFVIKRVVCKDADHSAVTEWCERILGKDGWGTSVQLSGERYSTLDPVIVLYDNIKRPIEQIELMIALRWAQWEHLKT
jgi:hypothetical protein